MPTQIEGYPRKVGPGSLTLLDCELEELMLRMRTILLNCLLPRDLVPYRVAESLRACNNQGVLEHVVLP